MKIGVLPAGAGPVTTGTSRPVIFLRTAARSWTESRRRMRCFSASSAGLTSPLEASPGAMTAGSTTMAHRASPEFGINVTGAATRFAARSAARAVVVYFMAVVVYFMSCRFLSIVEWKFFIKVQNVTSTCNL